MVTYSILNPSYVMGLFANTKLLAVGQNPFFPPLFLPHISNMSTFEKVMRIAQQTTTMEGVSL